MRQLDLGLLVRPTLFFHRAPTSELLVAMPSDVTPLEYLIELACAVV